VVVGAIALVATAIGLVFAGSSQRLPEGVTIAGVDVGGLTAAEAESVLEQKANASRNRPIAFRAAGRDWSIAPRQLGVVVDWAAAVDAAVNQGEGPAPVRGFRRIGVRLFGADIAPPAVAYAGALDYFLDGIEHVVNRRHREAAVELHGMKPVITDGRSGRFLDRTAAERVVVQSLAALERQTHVELPVRTDPPTVTAEDLRPAAAQVRLALSAPVRLALGPTRYRLPRYRLAQLLDLPADGDRTLRIGGPLADRYFARLNRAIERKPRDADFAITAANRVRVVPAREGRAVDAPTTGRNVLRAALSRQRRVAELVVQTAKPRLTTEEAESMHIKELVGAYETIYGGDANRVHNVQLVAHLIDKHLIAPGQEFSFNKTTGERTAEKGFLEAPVIINGELQTGLGGGVCQVSTTTFNAAYVAGLKITQRTNHALYISHYPLGRDATVNYPDLDLKFVNDTGHWLLVRTFVGSSSLTVALYGMNPHRRVETEEAPLVVTGAAPTKEERDENLFVGETVVAESGEPSRSTHVRRVVYTAKGRLLYDNTWWSSYRGEYRVVRVGVKPIPPEPDPPPTTTEPTTTTPPTTTTAPTTTAPATTTPAPAPAPTPVVP
jgi:vancomycin resistance protein YoaR